MVNAISNTNKMRLLLVSFVAVVLSVVGVVGMSQPAAATGECGSSYGRIGTYAITYNGERTGTLEVYWSGSTGKNCAIARCYGASCGPGVFRDVRIKRSYDKAWRRDADWYNGYAGPVYTAKSTGSCIDVYGGMSLQSASGGYSYYGSRTLNDVFCG